MAGPPPLSKLPIWSAPLVGLVALLAFMPALRNTLTHDDVAQVRNYTAPQSFAGWVRAAGEPWWPLERQKNLWRPVPRLSILMQKATFPGNDAVSQFYAINLFLHALVAMLVLVAARAYGMAPLPALLGALIFAAHPLHGETVHQIVGRAELFAALFMLLGLILLTRWGPFSPHAFWQQPLCLALALLSKEHAILYPLFVLLAALAGPIGALPEKHGMRRWLTTGQWRGLLGLVIGLLTVIAAYLYFRGALTGGFLIAGQTVPATENPLAAHSLPQRLPAALGVLGYAVTRLFVPIALSPDYSAISFPVERGWGWPYAVVGALISVGLVAFIFISLAGKKRGWALAVAGLAAWLLTSNIPLIIGVIAARRLWYFPMIPACLGIGVVLAAAAPRLPGRMRLLIPALVIALLIAASSIDARAWRSPRNYAEATLARFPNSWRALTNLAREEYLTKEFHAGLEHAKRATEVFPSEQAGWGWVGLNAMFVPGSEAEAEAAFRRAIALDPEQPETWRNLSNLLRMRGRNAEAADALRRYLQFGPIPDRDAMEARMRELEP